ncbi:hypothetical protein [Halosimplex halobium]|uniref:hypothetical protein n=1 Tax=Halosimplex halobium TaxID=3396618 RepID=UPI003F57714C
MDHSRGREIASVEIDEADAPSWLSEIEHLVVEFDGSGEIAALHYPYRTRYDAPKYGLLELDLTAPEWVSLPAGTYTIEAMHRVARCWRWDEIDIEHAPPQGAGAVATRQQPNDAPVPIRYLPTDALPEAATTGDALVAAAADADDEGRVALSDCTLDTELGAETRDILARQRRAYATAADSDTSGDEPVQIPLHAARDAARPLEQTTYAVVTKTTDGGVTLRPLAVRSPPAGRSLAYFMEREVPTTPDSVSRSIREDAPTNDTRRGRHPFEFSFIADDPLVDVVADSSKFRSIMSESVTAVFHEPVDATAFQRGDIFQVSDTDSAASTDAHRSSLSDVGAGIADDATLETVGLAYQPVLTGFLRHQLPTLWHVSGFHPEKFVQTLPNEHQVVHHRNGDGQLDELHDIEPIHEQAGGIADAEYYLSAEAWELPPSNGVFELRYERPSESLDDRRRITQLVTFPALLPVQYDLLALLSEETYRPSDELQSELSKTYVGQPLEILADRGLVERTSLDGPGYAYRRTVAGTDALEAHDE